MKKRKPPILLGTILLILVGLIVFWNMPKSEAAPIAPAPGESAPRGDVSADQVVKDAQSGVNSKPAAENKGPSPATGMPNQAPGSSIATPKADAMKPRPNDSAPQGQWYAPESNKPGK